MSSEFEAVIGLEVHVELKTKSKIFCPCPNLFGELPNINTCPVCLGLPGSLPVLNESALVLAVKAALALNCRIASVCRFDRKNYFYPDLPKAYQISQYALPLAEEGELEILKGGELIRGVRIERLHLEEDAGKLLHSEDGSSSFVDYNRCGVPLIEIVTAPDLRSPEEARFFLETLRRILLYTGVSDCKMEEGSLRCDANISLRPRGSQVMGQKVEIKNMNSFRAVQKGLEYEISRQEKALREGLAVIQETRRWDEARGVTAEMRSKEEVHDYRYFPEPDLPPLVLEESWIAKIAGELPELPNRRCRRYVAELGLTPYQADVLTSSKDLADFFEEALQTFFHPPKVANWLMGDVLGLLKEAGEEISKVPFKPSHLAGVVQMVEEGSISGRTAKEVLQEAFTTGRDPQKIVEEKGLLQISDRDTIREVVGRVLKENPAAVRDYQRGNKKALSFLVGKVMGMTGGQANPRLVTERLKEELEKKQW